jgi:hypothetical protein
MPALACGTTTWMTVWNYVAPSAGTPRAARAAGAQRLPVATITTGSVSTAIVSGQMSAGRRPSGRRRHAVDAGAEGGRRIPSRTNQKRSRHAREVGHGDADETREARLGRRTRAVNRRRDIHGNARERHEEKTISTMPTMAGRDPPAVMPSLGACVKAIDR